MLRPWPQPSSNQVGATASQGQSLLIGNNFNIGMLRPRFGDEGTEGQTIVGMVHAEEGAKHPIIKTFSLTKNSLGDAVAPTFFCLCPYTLSVNSYLFRQVFKPSEV